MNLFKREEKKDPKKGQKILQEVWGGLKLGEPNESIDHIKMVHDLSKNIKLQNKPELEELNKVMNEARNENKEDFEDILARSGKRLATKDESKLFFDLMVKNNEKFQNEKIKEAKLQKKRWYRIKSTIKGKFITFKEKMGEVFSFVRHEFLTVRKLIFLINDLFFGREYKNRKLLYTTKNIFIKKSGYKRGEIRFNQMVRNITKGAELNKRLIEGKY